MIFVAMLLFTSILVACDNNKNNEVYILDYFVTTKESRGFIHEWFAKVDGRFLSYTLYVPDSSTDRNYMKVSGFNDKGRFSEEKENIKIGEIIRKEGNITSIVADGTTYKIDFDKIEGTPKGFLGIEWGNNTSTAIKILKDKDYVLDERSNNSNHRKKSISITGEYLMLPCDITFNFYDDIFYLASISFDSNNENDYKLIIDNYKRKYGVPYRIESEGKIYYWYFDTIYSISIVKFSSSIVVYYEDNNFSQNIK